MRLTQDTRQALEAAAASEGRSISEMAERWLDEARGGHATVHELLGGLEVAPSIRDMILHAKRIRERVGDPSEDFFAREALLAGWRTIVAQSLPNTPMSETEIAVEEARPVAISAIQKLYWKLQQLWASEPHTGPLLQAMSPPTNARSRDPLSVYKYLEMALQEHGLDSPGVQYSLLERLPALAAEPSSFSREARAAIRPIKAFQNAWMVHFDIRVEAARKGRSLTDTAKRNRWVDQVDERAALLDSAPVPQD
jgi:hypothetical protein